MASELTLNISGEYEDADDLTLSFGVADLRVTVSARRPIKYVQNVGTSEEALTLGESATYGYMWVRNLDATNFVELRVATGGAKFAKLTPQRPCCLVPLGSGAQAPFAIADTAACNLEVVIIPV